MPNPKRQRLCFPANYLLLRTDCMYCVEFSFTHRLAPDNRHQEPEIEVRGEALKIGNEHRGESEPGDAKEGRQEQSSPLAIPDRRAVPAKSLEDGHAYDRQNDQKANGPSNEKCPEVVRFR